MKDKHMRGWPFVSIPKDEFEDILHEARMDIARAVTQMEINKIDHAEKAALSWVLPLVLGLAAILIIFIL